MIEKKFKHIYGPVFSWRLGRSLGIDPVGLDRKNCNFNCVYCQVGETENYVKKRKEFIPAAKIIKELNALPPVEVDYITFSGMGEPTLAENLSEMIAGAKELRKDKVAVITNSSLLDIEEVRKDLGGADFVLAKLDAVSSDSLNRVNRPFEKITFASIIRGLKRFRSEYNGKLGLQIMFIEANRDDAGRLAQVAEEIGPDEVEINTPLRPCPVGALSKEEISEITGFFTGMNIISVYGVETGQIPAFNRQDTLKRRGKAW